jgi:molybdopterin synthase sulfur carrier subunit
LTSLWVEFVGILEQHIGHSKVQLKLSSPITVSNLIKRVITQFNLETNLLFDYKKGHLTSNVLLLVNGKEINVLDGLETQLVNGDVITIISISHGG